jgi:hypothetical protein
MIKKFFIKFLKRCIVYFICFAIAILIFFIFHKLSVEKQSPYISRENTFLKMIRGKQ